MLLECDRRQACRFAGALSLHGSVRRRVDDVVRDVLGELANMIGGNLKSVLSRGIQLSMPSVVDGSDYCLRVCGAEVRERLGFQCSEGAFLGHRAGRQLDQALGMQERLRPLEISLAEVIPHIQHRHSGDCGNSVSEAITHVEARWMPSFGLSYESSAKCFGPC